MKAAFIMIAYILLSTTGQAQTKPDSIKSARDYIIEQEDKRPLPPRFVKPSLKKLQPLPGTSQPKPETGAKDKAKKCRCKASGK